MWKFLEKLKIELTYGPATPSRGNHKSKDTCTPVLIIALFTTAKTWKEPTCPLADGGLLWWFSCKKNLLVTQETACNAGDMGSMPGFKRSPQDGCYPKVYKQ